MPAHEDSEPGSEVSPPCYYAYVRTVRVRRWFRRAHLAASRRTPKTRDLQAKRI